jgi:DNA-binding CsgD family transcriptional regulator
MKDTTMDARSEQMLELLAKGASARMLAGKLGYSEGTVRVYLHNLYKVIGVRNKTEAVIWFMNRANGDARPVAVVPAAATLSRECFGEMALSEDLYAALGVMSSFLGPYGHVWEAGMRLKGTQADDKLLQRRALSRLLWKAFLQGDFPVAKAMHDDGTADRLLYDSAQEAVLLACLLLIGGYSSAAHRLVAQLSGKRRGTSGVTNRDLALLRAVDDALDTGDDTGLASLYSIAMEGHRTPVLKQIAMVALFHAHKARKDPDRARGTASAIWSEAEAARQQLEAMGVRPLGRDMSLPRPERMPARESVAMPKEKVAATR